MKAEVELYARGASPVHQWDARWKVVSLGLGLAVLATLEHASVAALGAALGAGLLLAAGLPWRLVLGRLAAAQVILLPCLCILPFSFGGATASVAGFTVSREGLQLALLFYLRALAIVCLALAVIYTTPMVVLLRALQALRVPRVLVEIALLTYRYLFSLAGEWTRLRWALSTRGLRLQGSLRCHRALANAVGVSLVRSLERTERIQQSMMCRGFQGRLRTLHAFRGGPGDWGKAWLGIAVAALLVGLDRWPWGS